MQVQRVLDKSWYLVNSAEKHFLASKNHPNEHEDVSYRMEPNLSNGDNSSIHLYKQPTNAYIYIFNNTPFKITGVEELASFKFHEYPDINFQLLVGYDTSKVYFYAFQSPKHCDSDDSSITAKLLGTIDKAVFPFAENFNLKSKLRFYYENGYYYLDCSSFFFNYITIVLKSISLLRFNSERLETFIAQEGHYINFSENARPEVVVTDTGIFDVHSFEFFELQSLIKELPIFYTAFYYKVFSLSSKKKGLFISETPIDFSNLYKKNRAFEKVNGILYDLSEKCFIFPHSRFLFRSFLLYDYGMPHIFFANNSTLNIISLNKHSNKFSKTSCSALNTAFSFFDNDVTRKKAFLFIKENKKTDRTALLVFNEHLNLEIFEHSVEFHSLINIESCTLFDTRDTRGALIPYIAKERVDISADTAFVNHANHTLGLIVKSPLGEFGELLYVPIDVSTHIDYAMSFFKYDFFTLTSHSEDTSNPCAKSYLKAVCRRNDFENYVYLINIGINSSRVENPFIQLLANNI